jgi:DNA-directed RNA polymerase specialized sigma24 family protein
MTIVAEHEEAIRRFLFRYLRGDQVAADILVQATLIEAAKISDQYKNEYGAFAWLSGIAERLALNYLREAQCQRVAA